MDGGGGGRRAEAFPPKAKVVNIMYIGTLLSVSLTYRRILYI